MPINAEAAIEKMFLLQSDHTITLPAMNLQNIRTPGFTVLVDGDGVLIGPNARPGDYRRLTFREFDAWCKRRWLEAGWEKTAIPVPVRNKQEWCPTVEESGNDGNEVPKG